MIEQCYFDRYLELSREAGEILKQVMLPHARRVIIAYQEVDPLSIRFEKDFVYYTTVNDRPTEESKLPAELFLRRDWEEVCRQRRYDRATGKENWRRRCLALKEEQEREELRRLLGKYGIPSPEKTGSAREA